MKSASIPPQTASIPPHDEQSHIRICIRSQRRELGLTQYQVADAIGLSRAIYSRIETGDRQIYFSDFAKLEKIFDLKTILNLEQLNLYKSITRVLNNPFKKVYKNAQNF